MKSFINLILLVLALALVGLFVLKKPNGHPWLSLDDFLPHTLKIDQKVRVFTSKLKMVYENITSEESGNVKVYRWKDSNGNWSYADKKNTTIASEELSLNPNDILVLPAFTAPKNNTSEPKSGEKNADILLSPNSTSPRKVLDLYKNANKVQKIMDDRQQHISKAIKESSG